MSVCSASGGQDVYVVLLYLGVAGDQRQALHLSLSDEHPARWPAVLDRSCGQWSAGQWRFPGCCSATRAMARRVRPKPTLPISDSRGAA